MKTKRSDNKFIIYQVLYIFVITVLALKGAGLDLEKVALKAETVNKEVRDSLIAKIDSLITQRIDFSINIDPKVLIENEDMKKRLASLNQQLEILTQRIQETKIEEPKLETVIEQTQMQLPIFVKQTFIQHTWNIATNTGSVQVDIYDPDNSNSLIVSIPPGQEKKFDLTNQKEVIVKFGSQQERIKVIPNKAPEVKIERVTKKMDAGDIYVSELQRITVFKVTIIDERPDQLKVNWSGPISVSGPKKDTNGNLIYNVSLKIATKETDFENWVERNLHIREADGRYKVNFFFTVVDERSKDIVKVGDSFFFTEFSK